MINIAVENNKHIVAKLFEPTTAVIASAVIAPAMGAPQSFYRHFAQWLADQGVATLTFDYQGMGQSATEHIKHCQADLLDWAQIDCSAALDFIKQRYPTLPTFWIGHSFGGQAVPLIKCQEKIDHVFTITSGNGYWRYNPPRLKQKIWFLWYFLTPITTALMGYFPGSKLGIVADLPKKIIKQWRLWCLHRDYMVGVEADQIKQQFANMSLPVTAISFSDDELLTFNSITTLHQLFSKSECRFIEITPEQVGLKAIGHFGFFKAEHSQRLWHNLFLPQLTLELNKHAK
ncbi:alpha/beta fold hydrolase [Alteromonadaceae bacterium BrNp21-10]|nr:alpha/beta fold hydrolase [Alteromonadaceae bacterium BrNp21-10]